MLSHTCSLAVYDDENQGSKVKVYLKANLVDGVVSLNDSGSYSNNARHHSSSSTSSINNRDSLSSHSDCSNHHGDNSQNRIILGDLSVTPEASWVTMDTKIGNIFMVRNTVYMHTHIP